MKIRSTSMSVWGSFTLSACALLFFTACTTTSTPPPEAPKTPPPDTHSATPLPVLAGSHSEITKEGVPGGIIVNTVEMTAKVTSIDPVNRKAMLVGPDGKQFTVKAGPEAQNFDQVQVGDTLDIVVTEELVVFLDKDGVAPPDGSAAVIGLAPKGAQPGGVAAQTTQITAEVIAVDTTRRKVTLLFDDGSSKIFPVRDDIDLNRHKPGEKVVFLITDMIALSMKKK